MDMRLVDRFSGKRGASAKLGKARAGSTGSTGAHSESAKRAGVSANRGKMRCLQTPALGYQYSERSKIHII